jgi:hypothetical protein
MSLEAFADWSADRIIEHEDLAKENTKEIRKRTLELFNKPAERADFITSWFLQDGYKTMLAETGNAELTKAYWDSVAILADKPLNELAKTAPFGRGQVWNSAASIIVATSQRQAMIESGLAKDAIMHGIELGEELVNVTKGLDADKIRSATYGVADKIKEKRNNGSSK